MSVVSTNVGGVMEDTWVVQLQGWLLKRGAGFKQKEQLAAPGTRKTGGHVPPKPKPKGKRSFFRRKGTLMRKGAGEKKRFFCLVTMAANMSDAPKAELRYFGVQKDYDAPAKGVVELESSTRVELSGHSTICLVTAERTYYLRPDKAVGEPHSAAARVIAGKWIYALEFAINGLKAWEMAGEDGKVLDALNPVTRLSTTISEEELEMHQERVARALTPRNTVRTNKMKIKDTAEEFESLWDRFGLHGYNALVAHFGPVLIDLQRMEEHLSKRAEVTEVELRLHNAHKHKSQDIALFEQQTTARMLVGLYTSIDQRAAFGVKHLRRLKEQVVAPISEIRKKLNKELDSIVKFHHGTTANIERLYKGVYEMNSQITELRVAFDTALGAAGEGKERKGGSFLGGRGSVASFNPGGDPELLEQEIASSVQVLNETKAALHKEEVKHSVRMKLALKSLYSLEIERLNAQGKVLERMMELELRVFAMAEEFFDEDNAMMQSIADVDPASDVQNTSKRLLRAVAA
ncbi:PH domain-containing protein [Durusdinium trenchii]|uniref:PH domain-containing protein n=1 Tax=Durusdinium trenchii TaxID=1381693 RepID=A0ABP0MNM2_9DINO